MLVGGWSHARHGRGILEVPVQRGKAYVVDGFTRDGWPLLPPCPGCVAMADTVSVPGEGLGLMPTAHDHTPIQLATLNNHGMQIMYMYKMYYIML